MSNINNDDDDNDDDDNNNNNNDDDDDKMTLKGATRIWDVLKIYYLQATQAHVATVWITHNSSTIHDFTSERNNCKGFQFLVFQL